MIHFDLRSVHDRSPKPLGAKFFGYNQSGQSIGVTDQGLMIDGELFFGISGEIHYSRINPDQWEDTLLKAKCGGINTVSTYVFWNVHEEEQGIFRFDGCRDLHTFLTLCKKHDLMVILRIGPFAHGEMRNGGLPDWLYGMPFEIRGNDPGYLACVQSFYRAIHQQTDGLYFSQNGPVVGIQLENEYMHSSAPWEITTGTSAEWVDGGHDGDAHILTLKRIAQAEGLLTPFYTCTAWGGAMAPAEEVLPLWGGYAYWPWIFYNRTGEHPCTPEYIYRDNHNNAVPKTYNFEPRYAPESMPYACCEMMGGMMCSYNYRFTLPPESVDALANIKLGSGCSLLGYYMYKGGTTPTGKKTPFLNEGQVSKRSYDYQAPIGEFGQRRDSYYRLRTLHDFCNSFAKELMGSVTVLTDSRNDMQPENTDMLRCCVRVKDNAGFLFVNNFQDHLTLPDRAPEQIRLELSGETIDLDVSISSGENAILPFNLQIGHLLLKKATLQPITRLSIEGNDTWFFMIPKGMKPEMVFRNAGTIDSEGICHTRQDDLLILHPDADRITDFSIDGLHIVILPRDEAMRFSHIVRNGQDIAVLSDSGVIWDGTRAMLETDGTPASVLTMPPAGCSGLREGPFTGSRLSPPESAIPTLTPRQVGPSRWVLQLPADKLTGHKQVLLRISYLGDIGQAFINGEMISDNFCNGQPWEIRLDPYADMLRKHPLVLCIVPIKEGVSVSVDSTMAARMEHVKETKACLEDIVLRFVDEIEIPLDPDLK